MYTSGINYQNANNENYWIRMKILILNFDINKLENTPTNCLSNIPLLIMQKVEIMQRTQEIVHILISNV